MSLRATIKVVYIVSWRTCLPFKRPTEYRTPTADRRLPIADCRLPTADHQPLHSIFLCVCGEQAFDRSSVPLRVCFCGKLPPRVFGFRNCQIWSIPHIAMAASVLFACGLNEQKLPPFIHISEESNVDGSFLITSILGQRLRISNAGTLLVCLQNNYQHYFNAGMRLGYNANIFLDKTLSVIDPLADIAKDLTGSKWLVDDGKVCELLLANIREQVSGGNFSSRISTTVIIDNLTILHNLGASTDDILQLCHELAALPNEFENLTIITKINNSDIYPLVDNNVAKLGTLHIRVVKLKSGVFREVDGKLFITRLLDEDDNHFEMEQSCKEILYKVNDRNVKIFNPGEIGLKA